LLIAVTGFGIPTLMAAFAGSRIHLALEQLAAARYLGGSALRNVAGGCSSLSHQIRRKRESNSSETTLQEHLKAVAAHRVAPSLPPLPRTRDKRIAESFSGASFVLPASTRSSANRFRPLI
jgi:hypothetical protein